MMEPVTLERKVLIIMNMKIELAYFYLFLVTS